MLEGYVSKEWRFLIHHYCPGPQGSDKIQYHQFPLLFKINIITEQCRDNHKPFEWSEAVSEK